MDRDQRSIEAVPYVGMGAPLTPEQWARIRAKTSLAEDPPASDEETEAFAAEEAADRPARLREFGVGRDECE